MYCVVRDSKTEDGREGEGKQLYIVIYDSRIVTGCTCVCLCVWILYYVSVHTKSMPLVCPNKELLCLNSVYLLRLRRAIRIRPIINICSFVILLDFSTMHTHTHTTWYRFLSFFSFLLTMLSSRIHNNIQYRHLHVCRVCLLLESKNILACTNMISQQYTDIAKTTQSNSTYDEPFIFLPPAPVVVRFSLCLHFILFGSLCFETHIIFFLFGFTFGALHLV